MGLPGGFALEFAPGGDHHVADGKIGFGRIPGPFDDMQHGVAARHLHDQDGQRVQLAGAEDLGEAVDIELLVIKLGVAHHHHPTGKEILLPLGREEYLQFAGDVGRDQLTLTVRDPRSLAGGQASTARVFRRDEDYGSNFVQEVKPGRYPVIAEAIGIEHR